MVCIAATSYEVRVRSSSARRSSRRSRRRQDDEILFTHNPCREILDGDALAPLELGAAERAAFAHNAVHFDDALLMDEIEHRFVDDGIADCLARNVVIGSEQADDSVHVIRFERHHEINVTRHAGLGLIVHRHRAGEHVLDTAAFQPR